MRSSVRKTNDLFTKVYIRDSNHMCADSVTKGSQCPVILKRIFSSTVALTTAIFVIRTSSMNIYYSCTVNKLMELYSRT
nr:unnamed protein product [Callosobruchus chinensis]